MAATLLELSTDITYGLSVVRAKQVISIQICFISAYLFCRKTITSFCNIFYVGRLLKEKGWCYTVDARSAVLHGFTGTRVAVQFTSNAPADSPVRTTLQRHGGLARPPTMTAHVAAAG